jgi:hypothetical protein
MNTAPAHKYGEMRMTVAVPASRGSPAERGPSRVRRTSQLAAGLWIAARPPSRRGAA